MKQVGIVLRHLGPSQLAFSVLREVELLLNKSAEYDCVIFQEDIVPPCVHPQCAIMNTSEIWCFNGLLIGTTLNNAAIVANSINRSTKLFYVYDLEWLRKHNNNFQENVSIYRNPKLKLITGSQSYAKAIKNYANRQVDKVIPHFNLEQIINEFYTESEA